MDRIKECQLYIKRWYLGEVVQTVEMDGADKTSEQCIQAAVVELLRDFIDNPIPENLLEGSKEFNHWIDIAFRKVTHGLSFGFQVQQEDVVKNLAFNYWAEGIRKVQSDPALKDRLMKCSRQWPTNKPA